MIPVTTAEEAGTSPRRAGRGAAEQALMSAVLEDAIRCLAGEIGPRSKRPELAIEAREWLMDTDRRWPFSFENICDALDMNADQLRSRLLRDAATAPAAATLPGAQAHSRSREAPAEEDIVRMIRQGHPLRVVAETCGVSISKASILSCGLASRMKAERDAEIRRLHGTGWTHRALAAHFRLSRVRIMRICAHRGRPATTPRRSAA